MYKLEFTLKQHTPIIHFQHDQDGATLRASEVKPKLDRFLTNDFVKYFQNEAKPFDSVINKIRLCVKNKLPSLYSCQICTNDNAEYNSQWFYFENAKPNKDKINSEENKIRKNINEFFGIKNLSIVYNTPFFANRDKVKNNEWGKVLLGKLNNNNQKIIFKTKNEDILEILKIAVPVFFIFENFGYRQNKGFGSFTENKKFTINEIKHILHQKYNTIKIKQLVEGQISTENVFFEINNAYKNLKNNQLKPDSVTIRNYYRNHPKNQQFEWEKKATSTFAKGENVKLYDNERYVRAMLGLANLYDYPQLNPKAQLIISDPEKEIERFKSPVFFKVIKNNIFLVCNPIHDEIKGKIFRFEDPNYDGFLDIATPNYFNENDFLNLFTKWQTL